MAIQKKKSETEKVEVTEEKQETAPEVTRSAGMVKVLNKAKSYLQQPSTNIRISAGEVKEVKDDSWVEIQVASKLLQRVK